MGRTTFLHQFRKLYQLPAFLRRGDSVWQQYVDACFEVATCAIRNDVYCHMPQYGGVQLTEEYDNFLGGDFGMVALVGANPYGANPSLILQTASALSEWLDAHKLGVVTQVATNSKTVCVQLATRYA